MIIGGQEFPERCPADCRFRGDFYERGQASICIRCPVFCCIEIDGFRLLEPDDYREDWAAEWKRFFDGEVDYPSLKFEISK